MCLNRIGYVDGMNGDCHEVTDMLAERQDQAGHCHIK
jgi:hypothetical protein